MKRVRFLRTNKPHYDGPVRSLAAALLVTTVFVACLGPKPNPTPTTSRLEQFALLPPKISGPSSTPALTKVCFTRGDFIYLRDLASGKEVRLVKGQSPKISPDGKRVLFVSNVLHEGSWRVKFRVKLLDLSSNVVRDVFPLSQLDAISLSWSRDGSKIAFDSTPGFGQFDPATGEWKIIVRYGDLGVSEQEDPIGLSSWGPDDRSLLIHSLHNLYEVSLDGKVVWQMPITDLGINSETRFSLSADRKYLLFDSITDTKERPVNEAVKMLEMSTKQVFTITPDTIEARTPMWLPSEKGIIFTCMKRFDHPHRPSICTIDIDGKNLSVLVEYGQQVSYTSY